MLWGKKAKMTTTIYFYLLALTRKSLEVLSVSYMNNVGIYIIYTPTFQFAWRRMPSLENVLIFKIPPTLILGAWTQIIANQNLN